MVKRILIVDDSAIVLAAAKHALVEAGYDVETRDGAAEVAARTIDGFDLILMDVQMPELCGDDVAAVLRHHHDVNARIYLFSTLDDAELKERAAEAELDGFIAKNAGLDHLVSEVRRILG